MGSLWYLVVGLCSLVPPDKHPRPTRRSNLTSAPTAHQRTRDDHASEIAEDYVEAVADVIDSQGDCRVKDLASHFGVSHVTVVRTVARLEQEGLVRTSPYQPIELTPMGRRLAKACKERHEVVYRFLLSIGVPEKVAAVDAEGIEHHVSRATLERMRQMLDIDM